MHIILNFIDITTFQKQDLEFLQMDIFIIFMQIWKNQI